MNDHTLAVVLRIVLPSILLAACGPLLAQSVTTSLSAPVPLTIQVADAGASESATLPAGPLLPTSNMLVALPGTTNGVDVSWSAASSAVMARTILTYQLTNTTGTGAFQAHAGQHEFVIEFQSATAVTVDLQISRQAMLTAGAAFPLVKIDYGADGVVDVASLPIGLTTEPFQQVGPQPLRVRVLVEADLVGVGSSTTILAIVATPRNDLLLTTPVQGCLATFPPPLPPVAPAFAGTGVLLTVPQDAFQPSVFVLGFGAQPLLLGSISGNPCILLPTPDVVFFEPTGQALLPLPASVRPVQFFVQGVTLTPIGLAVTDGVHVQAW